MESEPGSSHGHGQVDFRERDYLADKFVVACKLKDEQIAYLEENRFYDTSVPFMLNWQPANEQRIDKLQSKEVYQIIEEIPEKFRLK